MAKRWKAILERYGYLPGEGGRTHTSWLDTQLRQLLDIRGMAQAYDYEGSDDMLPAWLAVRMARLRDAQQVATGYGWDGEDALGYWLEAQLAAHKLHRQDLQVIRAVAERWNGGSLPEGVTYAITQWIDQRLEAYAGNLSAWHHLRAMAERYGWPREQANPASWLEAQIRIPCL